MARSATGHLRDVLDAIAAIQGYTANGKREFVRNPMLRDAVVARLIQIGQAVKDAQAEGLDLPRLSPDIAWASIAGMRDKLAHKYWLMDVEIVWAVVEKELPRLLVATTGILKES
jgi:uncharacterized protein with HEPN domain